MSQRAAPEKERGRESPLKSRPHFKTVIARAILSQGLSRSFINGVRMAFPQVAGHRGRIMERGILLRRRPVTYFTDVHILSALCPPLPHERALLSEHIISRERERESARRVAADNRSDVSGDRFLQSAASSRYRFTTDQYTRIQKRNIRNSQIRFPFRRRFRPRNVSAYFQHSG